ncbi:MAG: hypothetical protein M3R14_08660 [Acidobacteriota bacterium]|nr:hypothetical protein [Acidobacteriota bacterium]
MKLYKTRVAARGGAGLTDIRAVRDDFDLKGEFYLGEFVVSQENVYLIEPSGLFSVIVKTEEIFER